jgi:2-polyprenyl-6-methoxyphenol hydroxylase-like FAD-dependent oxidoreductase
LQDFLRLPHQEVRLLRGQIGNTLLTIGDFTHLGTRCKFVALMPQWHFLNFLAEQGSKLPHFKLRMRTEATDLIESSGRTSGLRAAGPEGPLEVAADLVIAADGRHSIVRTRAHLEVQDTGSPIDVLWLRLSRKPDDSLQTLGYFNHGRVMVTLDRGDYWQCAFVIRKGELQDLRLRGIESLRAQIVRIVPRFQERVAELRSWDDIKLLTVRVDRLRQWWKPGLLCIGDAAHAMSPVGGVGINLAIQDAVAAANVLAAPLREKRVTAQHLAAVQRRRAFPTHFTQSLQILIHERVINRVLGSDASVEPPWQMKLFDRVPALRRIPARVVGVGVRPEHVRTVPSAYAAGPR